MSASIARDLLLIAGVASLAAGLWLVFGMGVALIAIGAVFAGVAAYAEMRGGDA